MQQDYQLDSFIQYVGRLPTTCTHDRSVRAHYISFRHMGDASYHFDDGVVHKVNLARAYLVNLVMYRLSTVHAYEPPMSLENIPELGKSVILNRKKSTNGQDVQSGSNKNLCSGGFMNSGPPPLIRPDSSQPNVNCTSTDNQSLHPERPTRTQPSRRNKDFVVYFDADSQSSAEEAPPDKTHPDTDYVPESNRGTVPIKHFPRIFYFNTNIWDVHVMYT